MLLNLLLVALLFCTAFRFFKAGFLASALSMSAPLASLLFTSCFGGRVAEILAPVISETVQGELLVRAISYVLAYPLTFISILSLFLITIRITKKINIPVLSFIDKGLGGVLGLAVGLASVILISFAFSFIAELLGVRALGGEVNIIDGTAVVEFFEFIISK